VKLKEQEYALAAASIELFVSASIRFWEFFSAKPHILSLLNSRHFVMLLLLSLSC
jgi:hypothetical protein